MSPAHQDDRLAGVVQYRGGELHHPGGAGERLEEAVDNNNDLVQIIVQQEVPDTVLGLVVGKVEGLQVTGLVLSLEDHLGLYDVPAHREGLVKEGRLVSEHPVNVRTVTRQNTGGVLLHPS